jgi:general stress protein YciG
MAKKVKLPADTNKRAKSIVDIATGESEAKDVDPIKAAAAAMGRKGGLKGGKARAKSLTPEQRAEIAKKGAAARWSKKKK